MQNIKRLFVHPDLHFSDANFGLYFALLVIQSITYQFGCTIELTKCDIPNFIRFQISQNHLLLTPLIINQIQKCLNDQFLVLSEKDEVSIIFVTENFPNLAN